MVEAGVTSSKGSTSKAEGGAGTLPETSTTPQQTSRPLITCLHKSTELQLETEEADADMSGTLDLKGAFPLSSQYLRF